MNDMIDPSSEQVPKSKGPIKQFYEDLVMLLTEPREFFKSRYPEMTLTQALAFGVIVNWVASFLAWLTRVVRHETLFDGLNRIRHQLEELPFWKSLPESIWDQNPIHEGLIPAWLPEVFGIVLSPFQTLLRICISGFVLFLGAYFLIQKRNQDQDRIEISSFIKISAFSVAPYLIASILGFLPLGMGGFIGWVFSIALIMIGLMTRYRISGLRSVVIIILPGLVSILALACVIGVFFALIGGLFAALFGSH